MQNPLETRQQPDAAEQPLPTRPVTVEIRLPLKTILRIFAAMAAAYVFWRLWPLLLLIFLALFLAVTLNSFVEWLNKKGWSCRGSLAVMIAGMVLFVGGGLALIVPAFINQVTVIAGKFPVIVESVLAQLPIGDAMRKEVAAEMSGANWAGAGVWMGQLWKAGGAAVTGISQTGLILVIALYLLIDGKKIFDWALAFFSPLHRSKIRKTCEEISVVIFGYVSGQVITSVLVTIYAFTVLSLLHVPGALVLALFAGLMDVLPLVGFVLATIPAVMLAFTVSPQTGLLVLLLYIVFHAIESYVIIPKVYGKSLRVSTLTVLIGLLAGSLIAGIPGALAALPIIASYDAIERIWLKRYLREGVAEKHEQQKEQEFGTRTASEENDSPHGKAIPGATLE